MSEAAGRSLGEHWRSIDPARRRYIMFALIGVSLWAASTVVKRDKVVVKKTDKPEMSVVTAPRRDEGLAELRTRIATGQGELERQKAETAALKEKLRVMAEGGQDAQNKQMLDLQKELSAVKEEVKLSRSSLMGVGGQEKQAVPDLPAPVDPPKIIEPPRGPEIVMGGAAESAHEAPTGLGDVSPGGNKITMASAKTGAPDKAKGVASASSVQVMGDKQGSASRAALLSQRGMQFIPANTILRGVLMNGIDAPTSGMAQKQLAPTVMRIKVEAILPNRVTQDLRECMVSLGGYGVISSERVKLRSDLITCVLADGSVVETKIEGYVIDTDGIEGIKGKVVTKQGAVIARGLLAGFASGFGAMMSPSMSSSLSLNSTSQTYLSPDLGAATQSGALRGFSEAAKDYSKFLLETAKEMYPVIEVPGGVEVTLMLRRGFSLVIGGSTAQGGSRWDNTTSWFAR